METLKDLVTWTPFLLGGFARILAEWQRHAPDMPPAAQAQRALDAVSGVDLNPFAVEIARFRLLLAAVRAAGETRLAAAADPATAPARPLYLRAPDATPPTRLPGQARGPARAP